MKKFLVVCAVLMLPCFLVRAQEAEDTETGVVLSVIPRLDLNPSFSTAKDGSGDFTLGNSSLYTLFEGNLTSELSFSISNHWLSREPKYLYKNTWHSDDVNWLDWAYLTYSFGNWDITAGKQAVTTGGFEADEYDFEAHPILNTGFWNMMPVYQWGGRLGWTPSESNAFGIQMTTSPFGERPFKGGLFNYSGEWRGTYGSVETIASFTLMQTKKTGNGAKFSDCFQKILCLGFRSTIESVVMTLDVFNKMGCDDAMMAKGITVAPSVMWSANDNLDILVKGVYDYSKDLGDICDKSNVNIGAGLHWFPLKENKALRIHLTGAYTSRYEIGTISAGVLYNLSLKVK